MNNQTTITVRATQTHAVVDVCPGYGDGGRYEYRHEGKSTSLPKEIDCDGVDRGSIDTLVCDIMASSEVHGDVVLDHVPDTGKNVDHCVEVSEMVDDLIGFSEHLTKKGDESDAELLYEAADLLARTEARRVEAVRFLKATTTIAIGYSKPGDLANAGHPHELCEGWIDDAIKCLNKKQRINMNNDQLKSLTAQLTKQIATTDDLTKERDGYRDQYIAGLNDMLILQQQLDTYNAQDEDGKDHRDLCFEENATLREELNAKAAECDGLRNALEGLRDQQERMITIGGADAPMDDDMILSFAKSNQVLWANATKALDAREGEHSDVIKKQ